MKKNIELMETGGVNEKELKQSDLNVVVLACSSDEYLTISEEDGKWFSFLLNNPLEPTKILTSDFTSYRKENREFKYKIIRNKNALFE